MTKSLEERVNARKTHITVLAVIITTIVVISCTLGALAYRVLLDVLQSLSQTGAL